MQPDAARMLIKIALAAVLALALVAVGWSVRGWKDGQEIGSLKSQHAQELKAISDTAGKAALDALTKQTALQAANARIDALQGDLNREKADNEKLRRDVGDGRRVVRVAAACPATSRGGVPETTAAASVDPPTQVELSAAAGSNVLGIRSGIIEDQAKIDALQRYATEVCQGQ